MTIQAQACKHLLVDLNALADGELAGADVTRLVTHTQQCEGCGEYLETLRRLSELHRRSAALLARPEDTEVDAAEALRRVDPGALLGQVLGHAAQDEWTSLSRLFYELGKAYVLAGNQRLPSRSQRQVRVRTAPADIRRTEARARQHLNQVDELTEAGAQARRGELFRRRTRRLFDAAAAPGAAALVKGRRFLEEALAIDPALDEARLYLGFQLLVTDRIDRARVEFRRVHREGRDPTLRLMAMQWLGNLNVNTSHLDEAVCCYQHVVASDGAQIEPRLFSSFLNLPVTLGKLGRWEEAVTHFKTLVQTFPERLAQVREMLDGMSAFRRLIDEDQRLHQDLRDELPGLFAAA